MADLLRTDRTYATRKNAVKALETALRTYTPQGLNDVRYLIAVNDAGRFAPVLVGTAYIPLIHVGITVCG